MYYNSDDLYSFSGDRIEQMSDFLTDGWGCVRVKDVLRLFNISKMDFAHGMRFMKNQQLKVVECEDYIAVEFYAGYEPTKKYLNTLTVLTAMKNQNNSVIITDDTYSNLFTAKMYMRNHKTDELRSYYVIDTQFLSVPFYVLKEVIQAELDNGYAKSNRLIIIVYPDTEVEYIDIDVPIFFALLKTTGSDSHVEFYDNKQMQT